MMQFTKWHKIGLLAGVGGILAWCALWFGSDYFGEKAFGVVRAVALIVFLAALVLFWYCWYRVMQNVFGKKRTS